MTTREALISLIERLEEATEPSRTLDRAIGAATGYPPQPVDGGVDANLLWMARLPKYSSSRDAAAPGESIRKVERRRFDNGKVYWVAVQDADGDGCGFEGHGATEALARRIACLKARAKLMESTP